MYNCDEGATFVIDVGSAYVTSKKPYAIMAKAFSLKTYRRLVIGEGVEIIGERAFMDCDWITSVEIKPGVREIKREAFKGCCNLKASLCQRP